MRLTPRRPPGHGKRKALAYADDIISLRVQGHSLSAIREALEDVGVVVSISTVRREALRDASATAAPRPAAVPPRSFAGSTTRAEVGRALSVIGAESGSTPLPGKAIAEEFMRARPTNPLFLKEAPK